MRKVAGGLAQWMVSANEGDYARRVFRASDRCLPQDPVEQRIVELGDGRSAGEITETLYVDEIRAGAWIVDIALCFCSKTIKYVFDSSVGVIEDSQDTGGIKLVIMNFND